MSIQRREYEKIESIAAKVFSFSFICRFTFTNSVCFLHNFIFYNSCLNSYKAKLNVGHCLMLSLRCRPWDMSRFMKLQCDVSRLPFPRWARQWINIRKSFSNMYKCRRTNLANMLENLGMTFEGRQHSGIDDARNIARIALCMMKDGCNMRMNERLHRSGNDTTVVTVTRRSNSSSGDDDSEDESSSQKVTARCNGDSGVVTAMDGLSLTNNSCNGHGDRKRGQSSSANDITDGILEDEYVEDLLAYYALQKC